MSKRVDARAISPWNMQWIASEVVMFTIFFAVCKHWYSMGRIPTVEAVSSCDAVMLSLTCFCDLRRPTADDFWVSSIKMGLFELEAVGVKSTTAVSNCGCCELLPAPARVAAPFPRIGD